MFLILFLLITFITGRNLQFNQLFLSILNESILFPGGLALQRNIVLLALQGMTLSAGQQTLSSVSLLPSQSLALPLMGLNGDFAHMAPLWQG